MTLEEFFSRNPKAALAFSGGTDSAYLLYAGKKWSSKVKAYYLKTQFQPRLEQDDAENLARQLGCELEIVPFDVLSVPQAASNGADRCYFCKYAMFSMLRERAQQDGFDMIIDGTNASDDEDNRPGMRALRELGVRSPLRECGLTKTDIRSLSRAAGLFTWNKPAYACLATRVVSGEQITADKLERIEKAENAMLSLGFSDFRVRVSNGTAKLQVTERQMDNAIRRRKELTEIIGAFFETVVLDLKAREESL